jgi:hypothetical protein
VTEFNKLYQRERTKLDAILNRDRLVEIESPNRVPDRSQEKTLKSQGPEVQSSNELKGFKMMVTTIQPTNIYKNLLAQCCDKTLDRDTCNFLNAYFTVDKHKLFDCRSTVSIKLGAQKDILRRASQVQKMGQQIRYL